MFNIKHKIIPKIVLMKNTKTIIKIQENGDKSLKFKILNRNTEII